MERLDIYKELQCNEMQFFFRFVQFCKKQFTFCSYLDVDECAEEIHSCLKDTEECRNTEGAYECDVKCGKGFTYNVNFGTCTGKYIRILFND